MAGFKNVLDNIRAIDQNTVIELMARTRFILDEHIVRMDGGV